MKKKIGLIYCFAVFIGLSGVLNLATNVKGGIYMLRYFNTDRSAYHVSCEIKINASWDLSFEPSCEESYIQVQVFDSSNDLIWNSSKYDEPGNYDELWVLNISCLNLSNREVNVLIIRLAYYLFNYITMYQMDIVLSEKQVTVYEERINCELNNFKEILASVEVLEIEAQFYDLINDTYITNQEIFFEMLANESLLYEYNFTTNSVGEIEFSIDVLSQMSLGNNTLRFSITNSQLYNNTVFEYSVFVGESEAGEPRDNIIIVLIVSFFGIIGIVGLMVFIRIRK